MATEPERPIERLLSDCAKQRGAEAPAPSELQLHPATRRLLQAEVASTYGKSRAEGRRLFSFYTPFRVGFAWAIGLVMVAGALWFILPTGPKPAQSLALAKKEPVADAAIEETAKATQPAPPATTPPPMSAPALQGGKADFDLADSRQSKPINLALNKSAAQPPRASAPATSAARELRPSAASVPAGAPQGALSRNDLSSSDRLNYQSPSYQAAATPPPASAVTAMNEPVTARSVAAPVEPEHKPVFGSASASRLKSETTEAAPARQSKDAATHYLAAASKQQSANASLNARHFFRIANESSLRDAKGKITSSGNILASFNLQQSGRSLRIVDGDGSVYNGFLEYTAPSPAERLGLMVSPVSGATTVKALPAKPAKTATAAHVADLTAASTYFFRVIGTNRSLRQKVVFTGTLLAATNTAPAAKSGGGQGGQEQFQLSDSEPGLLQLLDSRISGRALIGDQKEIEIHAEPAGK